jgi:hypothetical protein
MTQLAPCPICGATPKIHEMKTGFVLSCVGARHTVAITDGDGQHQVALYRGRSRAEVEQQWNKSFGKDKP